MEDNIPAARRNLSRPKKAVNAHTSEDGKRGVLYSVVTEHGGGGGGNGSGDDGSGGGDGDGGGDDEKGLTLMR